LIKVAAIVEGYGDVQAVPTLIAKAGTLFGVQVVASNPIRGGEWPFLKRDGVLEKNLELAVRRNCDRVIVFVDLDDDCPVVEYQNAVARINEWRGARSTPVDVIFANREYETMFLHSPQCFGDYRSQFLPTDPEQIRGAKERVKLLTGKRYKETQDQLRFTQSLDCNHLFKVSRTFRKLCKAITGNGYDILYSMIV
jgi:hypothetical protein